MASIDAQIDAAVPLMKARAAQFDEAKTMDGVTAGYCINTARNNLMNANIDWRNGAMRHLVRFDLLDTMNLCALALSLLPEETS